MQQTFATTLNETKQFSGTLSQNLEHLRQSTVAILRPSQPHSSSLPVRASFFDLSHSFLMSRWAAFSTVSAFLSQSGFGVCRALTSSSTARKSARSRACLSSVPTSRQAGFRRSTIPARAACTFRQFTGLAGLTAPRRTSAVNSTTSPRIASRHTARSLVTIWTKMALSAFSFPACAPKRAPR